MKKTEETKEEKEDIKEKYVVIKNKNTGYLYTMHPQEALNIINSRNGQEYFILKNVELINNLKTNVITPQSTSVFNKVVAE